MISSEERKEKTETFLRKHKVPLCDSLPMIEDSKEVKLRSARDIGRRSIILWALFLSINGFDQNHCTKWLKDENLWGAVSPTEKKILGNKCTERDLDNVGWRSECVWVLLWACGKVEKLELPTSPISKKEGNLIEKTLPKFGSSTRAYLDSLSVRNTDEILDESDKIYRIHWSVRNAQINNKKIPANLNSDVVVERHHALNWITCYCNADWDDVTTDT